MTASLTLTMAVGGLEVGVICSAGTRRHPGMRYRDRAHGDLAARRSSQVRRTACKGGGPVSRVMELELELELTLERRWREWSAMRPVREPQSRLPHRTPSGPALSNEHHGTFTAAEGARCLESSTRHRQTLMHALRHQGHNAAPRPWRDSGQPLSPTDHTIEQRPPAPAPPPFLLAPHALLDAAAPTVSIPIPRRRWMLPRHRRSLSTMIRPLHASTNTSPGARPRPALHHAWPHVAAAARGRGTSCPRGSRRRANGGLHDGKE
ncbi:MAG: hypothetical protein Q9159_000201 [Coniocarpon cinnabarinum]